MPMETRPDEALAILSAMRDVAASGDGLTEADRTSLLAAGHWMLGLREDIDLDALPSADPAAVANALTTDALRREAVSFIVIMALIDGVLDKAKMERAMTYARALDVSTAFTDEIAEALSGEVKHALAHMIRDNMVSLTRQPWSDDQDIMAWLLPYRDGGEDPALAARFRALGDNPDGSFGRAFLDHFDHNSYAVPGEPDALNAAFSLPHDSSHVFSGYDTTPRGEILVSTFTAGMHRLRPISGHILPVIFSWHLDIKINDVAMSAKGAMDPAEFWHAWARGRAMKVDVFGPEWDFWSWTDVPLADLRATFSGEAPA